jgi:hypothetical protein
MPVKKPLLRMLPPSYNRVSLFITQEKWKRFSELSCYPVCVNASRPIPISIVVAFVLVAFMMACSSKDPLSLLIEDLEEAAENRDVDVFKKRLASSFTANDQIGREEALTLLRRYFLAYERITVDVTNVERSKTGTQVSFDVSFSGSVNEAFKLQNLLPSTASYQFNLRLVQEEGTLKVQRVFWNELSGL